LLVAEVVGCAAWVLGEHRDGLRGVDGAAAAESDYVVSFLLTTEGGAFIAYAGAGVLWNRVEEGEAGELCTNAINESVRVCRVASGYQHGPSAD